MSFLCQNCTFYVCFDLFFDLLLTFFCFSQPKHLDDASLDRHQNRRDLLRRTQKEAHQQARADLQHENRKPYQLWSLSIRLYARTRNWLLSPLNGTCSHGRCSKAKCVSLYDGAKCRIVRRVGNVRMIHFSYGETNNIDMVKLSLFVFLVWWKTSQMARFSWKFMLSRRQSTRSFSATVRLLLSTWP